MRYNYIPAHGFIHYPKREENLLKECKCDPQRLKIGGYDSGCPRHDTAN